MRWALSIAVVWLATPQQLRAAALASCGRACARAVVPSHRQSPFARSSPLVAVLDRVDDSCNIDEYCIHFVTGNPRKELEVNTIIQAHDMRPFRVVHVDIDLPELQGDPLEIARQKCREAARQVGGSVIVEDTSLCFSALNGLPGPYIKWFVDQLGNEGLYSMLAAHDNKSAYCQCTMGFSPGPDAEPLLFVGRTYGTVVAPQAEGGFGWDAIFVPDEANVPFSAMPLAQKNVISHRARALAQFIDHCKQHEGAVVEAIRSSGMPLRGTA